ncbi:hypothetical protein HAX54_018017, partial [Datura stramonium]|nr:hypothetical protein [Datura stramonium]
DRANKPKGVIEYCEQIFIAYRAGNLLVLTINHRCNAQIKAPARAHTFQLFNRHFTVLDRKITGEVIPNATP